MAAGGDRLHSRGTDLAGRVDPSAPDGVVNFNTSYLRHFGNAAAVSSLVVVVYMAVTVDLMYDCVRFAKKPREGRRRPHLGLSKST